MKYLIGIFAISILSIGGLCAQEAELDGSKRERLEALKVAYLTKELDLTPEEAQQFWPLYNEMNEKTRELRKKQRQNRVDTRKNFSSMTDTELSSAIQLELELEQEQLDLKKEYNQRFQKAIPIKKVAKLYAAEKGFRKELLKGARDKRKIPGGPPH
jgi:hypothetical protein